VVLRYPLHATVMLRSAGAGWMALSTTRYPGTLVVLANSDQLAVFVAQHPQAKVSCFGRRSGRGLGACGRDRAVHPHPTPRPRAPSPRAADCNRALDGVGVDHLVIGVPDGLVPSSELLRLWSPAVLRSRRGETLNQRVRICGR
jgi:hypothetical protein